MIKTLAKSIREYKKQTILAPLLIALEVIMDILIPYVMSKLVDNGIYGQDMMVIYKLGVLLVLLTEEIGPTGNFPSIFGPLVLYGLYVSNSFWYKSRSPISTLIA